MSKGLEESSLLNRRDFLLGAGAAAGLAAAAQAGAQPTASPRRLRIAHLTDVHVTRSRQGQHWMQRCLEHVHNLDLQPDFILNGGDLVLDAFATIKSSARDYWNAARTVFQASAIPIRHCIGNHDVYGWDRVNSGADPAEREYGKGWALDELQLATPYYSEDLGIWHLIVLDSTESDGGNHYIGRLDNPQFEWLTATLAAIPATKPVLIVSHIPILSACALFDGENEKDGQWKLPASWIHLDARRLKDLFVRHRNVKLCLSGHIHLLDRVDYNGVTYFCNGAVCGSWWHGDNHETPPGYAIIDLLEDGSFRHRYVTYGWERSPL